MTRPLLLDLFCGAGGAAMGYHRAGFDIVGVDIEPQPEYPFTFICDDALEIMWGSDFAAIHASPPCQAHTTMGNVHKNPRWPDLVAPTRDLLERSGLPYVIENVAGARRALRHPVELTGEMFGLGIHRARLFELGRFWLLVPPKPPRTPNSPAVYGPPDGRRIWTRTDGTNLYAWASIKEGQQALGVPWITDPVQIAEAIPPAYTQFIGEQLLAQLEEVART